MLSRAVPQINRSLAGVMSQDQLAQFASSVGQCAQSLEHRGPVALGNSRSLPGDGWNPSDYPELFPQFGPTFVDVAGNGGYRAGDWYSNYYAGPEFDLRTQLNLTNNQYMSQNHYGGNTLNIAGDTSVTNLTTQNIDASNVNTTNINYTTVNGNDAGPGPSGPQGDRGLDGQPGPPGAPGGIIFQPVDASDALRIARQALRLAEDAMQEIDRLRQALANISAETMTFQAVDGFSAAECNVTWGFTGPVRVNVRIPF